MGITVELWRARIGQFSGGRGSRPHSKAPSTKQPLHFSDTVGTTAKVVQGGLLLLVILTFLSSHDKSLLLKCTRNAGLLIIAIVGLVHSLAHLLLLAGDIESNPGPQMDEVLTLHEHLEDACSKLFKARTEWFNIGLTLGVDDNTLTAIRQEHSSNHGDCLRDMLAHRIKATDSLTWGDLCKSLRHDTVGHSDVADEIKADNLGVDCTDSQFKLQDGLTEELMAAAQNGHVKGVEVLIAAGAEVNFQTEDNLTALYAASHNGHDEVVRVLLAAKAIVNTQDMVGQSPLWVASFKGHQTCVELLIDAGANVDVPREADGITALIVAAQNGHVRTVEVLIAAGAQVDIQEKDGGTALCLASRKGHCGVVRMLLEAKADVHIKTNENWTAMFIASYNGHDEIVTVLLAAKAAVNIQDKSGQTPLWVASFNGHQKCMELLIDAGANVNVPREDGGTALMIAAQNGHVKAVELLIAFKAQVNIQTKNGGTALCLASQHGHCGVVRMLLEAKADVNIKDNDNRTALHAASDHGHDEIVKVLLAAKATVNTQSKSGQTSLWSASFSGHQKCMELLIDAGAYVDVPTEGGTTALWVAAQNGHVRAVDMLIASKAQVDIQQKDGATALHMASQNGHCEVVRMLLEAKADVNFRTNGNLTALHVASRNGHDEIMGALLAAMATNTQTKTTTVTPEYKANPPVTHEHKANPPVTGEHKANPPVTGEHEANPPVTGEHKANPPVIGEHKANPPITGEHKANPPVTGEHKANPPVIGEHKANSPVTREHKANPSATPEYEAIRSCRVDLTERLSPYFKDVAKHLRQSGALTDKQCQEIISAEMLLNYVLVDIKDPDTTLDAFAGFVTAMKQSGNTYFQTFVRDKIEAKRRDFYRELLQVPPGLKAQEFDVFISYSHEDDTKHTVDTLLRPQLELKGLTVFVDRDNLRPGDKWRSEITSAIKTCKAFVVVLTKRYVRSLYCNGEFYEAEALGKRMFPVVCEKGWEKVPGGASVTEIVKEVQYVSLVAEDSETQLTDLVQSIKTSVSG